MDFWKLRCKITFLGPLRSKQGWTHEAVSFRSALDELPGIRDSHYTLALKLTSGLVVLASGLAVLNLWVSGPYLWVSGPCGNSSIFESRKVNVMDINTIAL